MHNNKKAFTLIELLVVVLIIGILAAIAIPQYLKAVERSRVASLLPIMTALENANKIFHLTTGKYTTKFEDLDVSIPQGATILDQGPSIGQFAQYPNGMWLNLCGTGCNYSVKARSSADGIWMEFYITSGIRQCMAPENSERLNDLCKKVFNVQKISWNGSGYNGYYIKL
jgi:prepilin-type N-terminal cleavage/methylation domain-containing protein